MAKAGLSKTRKSNSEGNTASSRFRRANITVRITASGFAQQVRQIELLVNQTGRLDVSLALQAASSTVEVYAQTVTLNTNDATIGTPSIKPRFKPCHSKATMCWTFLASRGA